MRTQFIKYYLLILTLMLVNSSFAQTDQLFWFVAPEVNDWHGDPSAPYNDPSYGQPTHLRFSNTEDFEVTVTISQPSPSAPMYSSPITVTIPANSTRSIQFHRTTFDNVTSFDLDNIENYINPYPVTFPDPGNVGYKGLRIEATGRITAYYEVTAKWNMEIMSLKGRNALGTEFFVPFETVYSTDTRYDLLYSAIDIVATEPNTQIQITPTQNMLLVLGTQQSWAANTTYTIVLDEGETFTAVPYDTDGDGDNTPWDISRRRTRKLAGTKIVSNKPIAVNTKDDLVSASGVDLVADQLVPVNILGNDYIVMQNVNLTHINEYAYVLATDDNTEIFVNGISQGVIDEGEQMPVLINGNKYITSPDSAFYVYHVSGVNYAAAGAQQGGAVIPNVTQCTGSYSVSFVRSSSSNFYMNVMVRDGGQNGFEINGNATLLTAGDFTGPITTPSGDWYIASKWFSTANIPVDVVQTITNVNDKLFHLGILNGYDDCFYGYFSDFNAINVQGNVGGTINVDHKTCYGERVELVAYGANSYFWKADKEPSFLSNPTAERPVIYPTEDRRYTVIGYGDCSLTDSTQINVYVADPIVADFALDNVIGCSPLDIMIENNSREDWPVWKYQWYYGDGSNLIGDSTTAAAADTLYHTYINTSDTLQNLKFTLVTENDFFCKDTLETDITVKPEIHAGFTPDILIGCNPLTVNFTDNSTGNLDKYRWVFGDGILDNTVGDNGHSYSHFNTSDTVEYDMELQLTSPFFCRDTARTTIRVYPYLESAVAIDEDDGCSPLNVTFTNISAGEDSLVLDFGDGNFLYTSTFNTQLHTYTNTGTTVLTRYVVLKAINDEGCEEIWRDTIIVYPEVRANYNIDGGSYIGCNSRNVTFTNTSNYGTHVASQFLWTFGDGTNSSSTAVSVPHTYNNTTSDDKTYNFTLHAESQYGCSDDTSNTITIYRADANFTVDNNEGCSVLPVNITNTSIGASIPVTGWSWNYGDGSPVNTNQQPGTHLHNYTNTSPAGATQTRNLSLTVTRNATCSDNKTVPISVYPAVDVSFTTNPAVLTICDSVQVNFNSSLAVNVPGTTYEWNFGDGTSSNLADPAHLYRNITNPNAVNYTARVTATTTNGCTDTESTVVTVRPYVNAKFSVDEVAGCSPFTIDAVATEYIGIPADHYLWTYGDGYNPTVSDPPAHTYPANPPVGNDVYTLRLDVSDPSGNCTDFATKTITVYDEVVADFNPKNSINCNPYTVNFVNNSINGNTYKWNFGDLSTSSELNPSHTFTNSNATNKIYNVELEVTSNEGCTDIFNSNVTVYPYVLADFDINITEGCSPLTVHVINNSRGGTYYWFWDDDDLTLANRDRQSADNNDEFDVTYTNILTGASDIHYLTLIARNGTTGNCYDTLKIPITVHPTIDAQFTLSPASGAGCNPLTVNFSNTTTNASDYNWYFGDGSSSTVTSPSHLFTNTTVNDKVFNVKLIAESSNGCSDSLTQSVTVYSKVISEFSVENSEGCPPFSTTIDNTSIGNPNDTYQWLIDNNPVLGAPSDISDFSYTYNNTLTAIRDYEVKLIATNPHGCTSEYKDTVTVYEYVEASYSMDVDEGCTPLNITFTDLSSVPASTKYSWDFGDGATSGLSSPSHTFYNSSRIADKTYTIDLTVQSPNYCSDDTSMIIDVYHQPLSKFFIDRTASCPPLISNLSKESQGEDIFEWRFGDGNTNTTNTSLTYTYPNTLVDVVQNYTLELWVGTVHNCKDSTSLDLSVFPDVIADFTYDDEGCSPFVSSFTNTSTSPAQYFYWDFDDGNTSNQEDPIHEFTNTWNTDRTYNVYLKASSEYNCWDTITKPVTAFAQPIAEFNIQPIVQKFPESEVFIDNKSNAGPFNYSWDFGDYNSSQLEEPNVHEYEHWGEYDISLTITSQTSSCNDNITKSITILPPDVNADFSTNIDGGCLDNGLTVDFTAAASVYSEVYSYTWDFGDGATGTGANISHTYENPGTYYVKMTASGEGGEDYEYKTIRVYANPEANFEVMPEVSMIDASTLEARVEFYNLSTCNDTSGCDCIWDFGDGNTANSSDVAHGVTHGYTELGKYDIKLTVTNSYDCVDTLLLPEEVEIIGAGEIAFPNAFTPNGDGINDTFRPVSQGVIEYELLVYNRWGELLFKSNDLSEGWNGKINGKLGKSDVYVWKSMGKFTNGRTFEVAGDVTLIR